MKIVQINATCGQGSTGDICLSISRMLTETGIENYVLYTVGDCTDSAAIKVGNLQTVRVAAAKSRLTGNYGFTAKRITKQLLNLLRKIQPDIVHLHNLHSHNCHLQLLLDYLREKRIKVFWTFHDCWAFTAYCPHYTLAGCSNWKTGCRVCPQYRHYSLLFNQSETLYNKKKALTEGLRLTVITPSYWLAGQVRQSFFRQFPVKVIHNGVDCSVFFPRKNDFRKRNGLENVFVLLGVAFRWDNRKGLDVFIELYRRLNPQQYKIVLVGTDDEVDKLLPDGIISIHRTERREDLAELYTAADVFVNPTREEVLGLVNLEANACGTPVVTFNAGGSPECICKTSGVSVEVDDIESMETQIVRIVTEKPFTTQMCVNRAAEFDKDKQYRKYLNLYAKA